MLYQIDRNKMRDPRGAFRTKTLFVELSDGEFFSNGDPICPIFTLEEEDKDGYLSFKRLYLEIGDPTEYKQAVALLGSTDHWDRLVQCKDPSIVSLFKSCRKALAMKLESIAFEEILKEGMTSEKASVRVTAFKQILNEAKELNEDKRKASVGRPPKGKEEVKVSEEEQRLKKDLQRITPQEDTKTIN